MFHEDENRIRRRAYEIWDREGRPEGRADAHWEMARELVAQEEMHRDTLTDNPSRGPDDVATRERPVEPLLVVENLGEVPGLTDQGEEAQYPMPRRDVGREGA